MDCQKDISEKLTFQAKVLRSKCQFFAYIFLAVQKILAFFIFLICPCSKAQNKNKPPVSIKLSPLIGVVLFIKKWIYFNIEEGPLIYNVL